jgi:hypothetical protein
MRRWLSAVVRMRSTPRGHKNRRGVAGRGVIDDLIQIEGLGGWNLFVAITVFGCGVVHPHPLIRFAGIIQPQVVINGLGRQHGGRRSASGCRPLKGAVSTDADQPLDAEFFQPRFDHVEVLFIVGINIIPGRTDERAALGGVEFGNFLKQRVEMNVRHARVEQAVEPLDEADNFDLELVGAHHRAVNGGVQRGGVAAGGQDANAFHKMFLRMLLDCCCCSSCCTMISSSRLLNCWKM